MGVDIYEMSKFGLDVDALMDGIRTPTCLEDVPTEKFVEINAAALSFAKAWGRPFGFAQEQNGAIVQDIFPIKKNESEQISSSSQATLEMHTETAFHPWLPSYVFLLCLRGDESAGTTFVDLEELKLNLSQDEIDLLHRPIFQTSIDVSFIGDRQDNKTITTPILFNNGSSMRYDRGLMSSTDKGGQYLLDKISDLVDNLKIAVFLRSGQMAVISNWNTIHGRTSFKPRYDGTDRWLKRILVRRSMPFGYDIDFDSDGNFYIVKCVL
jgi:L-asparagine oxygenase